jgi:hypothetical protein
MGSRGSATTSGKKTPLGQGQQFVPTPAPPAPTPRPEPPRPVQEETPQELKIPPTNGPAPSAPLQVRTWEQEHKGDKTETLVVYKNLGTRLFSVRGTNDEVKLTQGQFNLMKDRIVTHNHPSGKIPGFSAADYSLARNSGLKEMRAVDRNYTHVMTPRPGTNKGKIWESLVQQRYDEIRHEVFKKMPRGTHLHDAEFVIQSRVAAEFGFNYYRIKK